MGRRTKFDYDEQLKMRKRNIGNSIIKQQGLNTKNRYKQYEDVLLFVFSTGIDSQLSTLTPSSQQLLAGLPQNENYFPSMDSVLQTASKSVLTVSDPYITAHYGLPTGTTVFVFGGTTFLPSDVDLLPLSGTPPPYILIPSAYPIFFGTISYQVIPSTPPVPANATLRIGTNPVQIKTVGQLYTINNTSFRFLIGGSPGLSQFSECPNITLLDGGLNTETQVELVDGGTLEREVLCYVEGGIIS
jgi:hypothetical protein